MSIMEAAELALKLLFFATITDKLCGGTLRVFHLGINGPPQERSIDAFRVYSRKYWDYNLHSLERKTILLLYPTSHPPIYADDLLALWKREGIVAAHLVKKKRDFHVHRLVLESEKMASKVYDDCKKKAEPETASSSSPLQEFVAFELKTKSSRVRAWVQMCSEECLKIITQLPEGPQINDSLLPRIITLPPIPEAQQLDFKTYRPVTPVGYLKSLP
ncbi:hypothetical protein M0R45_028603 [Rubus argutus]|uniref:Uncharacterized protein n=1 Tax=Rubus argutus TaxID=59490 RepID=A0AAW1W6G8_RUBAR